MAGKRLIRLNAEQQRQARAAMWAYVSMASGDPGTNAVVAYPRQVRRG